MCKYQFQRASQITNCVHANSSTSFTLCHIVIPIYTIFWMKPREFHLHRIYFTVRDLVVYGRTFPVWVRSDRTRQEYFVRCGRQLKDRILAATKQKFSGRTLFLKKREHSWILRLNLQFTSNFIASYILSSQDKFRWNHSR